jgi:hypothetical protein
MFPGIGGIWQCMGLRLRQVGRILWITDYDDIYLFPASIHSGALVGDRLSEILQLACGHWDKIFKP